MSSDHKICSPTPSGTVLLDINKVLNLAGKTDPNDVVKVNAFAMRITAIQQLSCFRNLMVLSLSSNSISDISGLKNCFSLVEIYLRKNNISDLRQIGYLQNLNHLGVLFLQDNPCALDVNYRKKTLRCLKFLSTLDIAVVTDDEKCEALNTTDEVVLNFERSIANYLEKNKDTDECKDIGTTVFKGLKTEGILAQELPKAFSASQNIMISSMSSKSSNIFNAIRLLMSELNREDIARLKALCDDVLTSEGGSIVNVADDKNN